MKYAVSFDLRIAGLIEVDVDSADDAAALVMQTDPRVLYANTSFDGAAVVVDGVQRADEDDTPIL